MDLARTAAQLLLTSLLLGPSEAQSGPTGTWQSLFDGATLDGWSGDPDIWSVRDGCIVGSTVGRPATANTFLIRKGATFADFELTFEARLVGNNSGIQYRSRVSDPDSFKVVGYQIDIHPKPEYVGMLYEEGLGRGVVVQRGQRVETDAAGAPRVLATIGEAKPVDLTEWHRYRVVARGNHILHEVDGVVTVDFIDHHPRRLREGVFALQVHAGAPMTVSYRNLRVKRLAAEPERTSTVPPLPQWVWADATRDQQKLILQRRFRIDGPVRKAELFAVCDNHYEATLNGVLVARGDDWGRAQHAEVTAHIRDGDNYLLVRARNDGGPAGLALRLRWKTPEGAERSVTSDGDWRCADVTDQQDRLADWQPVQVLGAVGTPGLIWSNQITAQEFGFSALPQRPREAGGLKLLPGFAAERLYDVPRSQGSWVALAADASGRLYAADQRKGLYRVTPAQDPEATTTVERVPVDLGGAQGLLWAFGALYVVVNDGNASGLYRVSDTDGDDRLDRVEKLRALIGSGEHGPHAVVLAPDGASLYVIGGNHSPIPELAGSAFPVEFREGTLLPQLADPRGHARGIRAPGGWICRADPDGERWELVAVGFRNAYDLAVSAEGELFTFDADMEWDLGLPWYRPTRVVHVASGADYGWRTGSGKWPDSYPDSLPPMLDVGPASPTGVLFGTGARFPARYQRALYALDWTYGTLYAVHLERDGASHRAELEEFVVGRPLALTDAAVGADGALYFVVGGRGTLSTLYRVTYSGEQPTNPVGPVSSPAEYVLRRQLEEFHGRRDPSAVDAAFAHLGHDDRFVRHAARLALEAQPVADWRARSLAESEPAASLGALLALARCGTATDCAAVLSALARLPWQDLDSSQRIAALRVEALCCSRLGKLTVAQAREAADRLLPRFPSGDEAVDRELARLLVYLQVPGAAAKLVAKLDVAAPPPPPWAELARRNAQYGGTVLRMLEDMPPVDSLHYAHVLRLLQTGWTPELRRQYFSFFPRAARHPGGMSYLGYLKAIRKQALAACSEQERRMIGLVVRARLERPAPFAIRAPRGPGREWTVDEALKLTDERLRGRDFESGRNLFFATSCAVCHHFDGHGGAIGPDLSTVGNKFGVRDLLQATLEPSAAISDQYGSVVVHRRDGSTVFGRVVERPKEKVVEVDPPDPELEPERVLTADIASIEPSPVSQMPAGLVNTLNGDELLDLLAYLLSGGDRNAPVFKR